MALNQPKNLDLNAVALAKAIKYNESGGNYKAKGGSTENGAYQFMPTTWSWWAGKYLGNEKAEMTPANQNYVAYHRIKEWKDEGYKPQEILSMWNSGIPMSTKKGVNKYGVEYDVPAYVEKGMKRFEAEVQALGGTFKTQEAQASTGLLKNTGTQTPQAPQSPQSGGFLGNMARGLVNPFIKAGISGYQAFSGIKNLAEAGFDKLTGDEAGYQQNIQRADDVTNFKENTFNVPFFGPVKGLQDTRDSIKTGAEVGTTIMGGGAGTNIVKQGIKGQIIKGAVEGGKAGLLGGAATGFGNAFNERESVANVAGSTIGGGLAGGVLGGIGGGVLGGASSYLSTKLGGSKTAQALVSDTDNSFVARTVRRIENYRNSRKDLKAQAIPVQNAVKVGIPQETATFVSNSSKADKSAFAKMLDLAERGVKTLRPDNRPQEVVGNTLLSRVKHIADAGKNAGTQLGNVIKAMPKKPIPISQTYTDFVNELGTLGVRVRKGELIFDNSSIGDLVGSQDRKLLQIVFNDLNPRNTAKHIPANLERLRQRLFANLRMGKANQVLDGQVESVLQKVRENLRDEIAENTGEIGKKYLQFTQEYAMAEGALSKFYALVGRKWSGAFEDTQLKSIKAGEVASRALGNASADVLRVISEVEETARDFGLKADDDVVQQIIFNDIIEQLVGSTQTRNMAGQVAQGVRSAGEEAVNTGIDAATGNIINAGRRLLNFTRSISPEEQILALKNLLR